MGFYTKEELLTLGLSSVGDNVLISKKASIYSPQTISIASNVRIDDFVILSGKIEIANFVHIGAFSALIGGMEGIVIEDFVGISIGCKIFASSDDFSGGSLSNPMIPNEFKNVCSAKVVLQRHSLLGSGSVILPTSKGLAQGVSVGALSLVMRPNKPFGIYFGSPAKRIMERDKNILLLEEEFLKTKALNLSDNKKDCTSLINMESNMQILGRGGGSNTP
ncbi:acyltransferase [Helicobacter muridarum]|uniref:acyltransferase n=1 Tax=Helicobacter muridarum TaxID=216 RepID=UPI000CF06252|nr:transferase [Helicobacter muridarum]